MKIKEKLKSFKNFIDRNCSKKQKIQFYAAVMILVIGTLAVSLAWYRTEKMIATMTRIRSPQDLYIASGHEEDISALNIGDIDVVSGDNIDPEYENTTALTHYKKDYVFCVYGYSIATYYLQLGVTTNLPFTYAIYSANEYSTKEAADAEVARIKAEGGSSCIATYKLLNNTDTYYYVKEAAVSGRYLNRDSSTGLAITDVTQAPITILYGDSSGTTEAGKKNVSGHDVSYGQLNDSTSDPDEVITDLYKGNVQKNAEPVYWQSYSKEVPVFDQNTGFCYYYILEITWTSDQNMTNNKETDMLYISAGGD